MYIIRNLLFIKITVFLAFVVCACSSSNTNNENANPAIGSGPVKLTSLVAGESTKISPGDTLKPIDENTEIEIVHVIEDDSKIVKVISGKVSLSNVLVD